jgi:hypothetical protein
VLLVAAAVACSDGGGDHCGAAGDASISAPLVTAGAETFAYRLFTSSENNDCPGGGAAVSVTVAGEQDPAGFPMTFCLPNPDQIDGAAISLADASKVLVIDVSAMDGAGCTYAKSGAATGTITFDGFCTTPGARYNLTLSGSVPGTKTCPGTPPVETPVTMQLAGTVAVDTH